MSEQYTRNVIEAGLLAAGKSLTLAELAQLFDESGRPPAAELRTALDALAADYAGRALELRETASGFRVQVRREFATEVARLWPERPQRYSRALLETLALIAYRQPITRAEIESVRGVAVNPNIVKTLLERSWIRVVGHRDLPGRPELLGTTREFLDYFGLRSLEQLPTLAQLRSLNDIDPQLSLPVAGAAAASGAEGAATAEADAEAAFAEATAIDAADAADAAEDDSDGGDAGGGDAPLSAASGLVAAPPGTDD